MISLKLLDPIKNFFKPKGKTVKVMKTTPEDLEKVPIAVKKALGLKEAELQEEREKRIEAEKKLAKYEGKETEEEKIVKDLLRSRAKIDRIKRGRRLKEYFPKMGRVVTDDSKLYTDGKTSYPFLCGFEKEETETGWGYNLLLKSKNKRNEIRVVYRMPLDMIFHEPEHLVSAIKYGVAKTRFDSKGIFHSPEFMNNPCSKCEFAGNYYKTVSSMQKEYGDKIAKLNDTLDSLRSRLKDARIREENAHAKLKDMGDAIEIADMRADLSQGFSAAQLDKFKEREYEHKELLLSSQDSEVNRVLTQKLNDILVAANKNMAKRLGVEIPESVEKRVRKKVVADVLETLGLLHDISPRREEITRVVKPVTETKKKEK